MSAKTLIIGGLTAIVVIGMAESALRVAPLAGIVVIDVSRSSTAPCAPAVAIVDSLVSRHVGQQRRHDHRSQNWRWRHEQ